MTAWSDRKRLLEEVPAVPPKFWTQNQITEGLNPCRLVISLKIKDIGFQSDRKMFLVVQFSYNFPFFVLFHSYNVLYTLYGSATPWMTRTIENSILRPCFPRRLLYPWCKILDTCDTCCSGGYLVETGRNSPEVTTVNCVKNTSN